MREHAEMIANLDANVPLIADADTGYGGMSSLTLKTSPIPISQSQVQ
jgi:isocitrate lyase